MGRPLRVLNTSDLAEMSDAEIKVIEEAFSTLKTLKPKTLIENDTLWREMIDKYDEYFTGGM